MDLDGVSIGSVCATVDETVVTSVVKGAVFETVDPNYCCGFLPNNC